MRIGRRLLVVAGVLAGAAGCKARSLADGGIDGSVDVVAAPDVGAADTGTAADVVIVTPYPSGTCSMPVNLNTLGTASGTNVTTIVGSTTRAPMAPIAGLPAPSCAPSSVGYEIVFAYTMATTAVLEATTDVTGTDPGVDTVVYMLSGCGSTATELACDDDDAAGIHSTAFTPTTVQAFDTVYIVVAGHSPQPSGSTNTPTGTVALRVSEFVPRPLGMPCDAFDPVCVMGATCTEATLGDPSTASCVADGTATNSACRTSVPYCDPGLACTVPAPSATSRGLCQVPIADGGACSPTNLFCVAGDTCIADPSDAGAPDGGLPTVTGHCRADGSRGGACHADGTCNTGLVCNATTHLCG